MFLIYPIFTFFLYIDDIKLHSDCVLTNKFFLYFFLFLFIYLFYYFIIIIIIIIIIYIYKI